MAQDNTRSDSVGNLFGSILKSYGISFTHLSAAIPVLVGSLGMEKYFDPAAWISTLAVTLAMIYLFNRVISPNILKTLLVAVIFAVLFGGIILWLHIFYADSFQNIIGNKKYLTAICSFIMTVPMGLLILSYNKQEAEIGDEIPSQILQAVDRQIRQNSFYKSDIKFDVSFEEAEGNYIWLKTVYSYNVTNRSKRESEWKIMIEGFGKEFRQIDFWIDNKRIDIMSDPSIQSARGYCIPHIVAAGKTLRVSSVFTVKYSTSSGDLFSTYDPATDYSFSVTNNIPESIRYVYEVHYHNNGHQVFFEQNKTTITIDKGLLPYEGVVLKWVPVVANATVQLG